MILTDDVILGDNSNPLMILQKFSIQDDLYCFDEARQELHSYWTENAVAGSPWGYYYWLDPKPSDADYPRCAKLRDQLQKSLLPSLYPDLNLAFFQYMPEGITKPNNSEFHLDVHDANGIERREGVPAQLDVLRVLLNAHSHPRILRYLDCSIEQLQSAGIDTSGTHYNAFTAPAGIQEQRIEIPPIESGYIWMLAFWANIVPHVGFSTETGQFLISYGRYADRCLINLV